MSYYTEVCPCCKRKKTIYTHIQNTIKIFVDEPLKLINVLTSIENLFLHGYFWYFKQGTCQQYINHQIIKDVIKQFGNSELKETKLTIHNSKIKNYHFEIQRIGSKYSLGKPLIQKGSLCYPS